MRTLALALVMSLMFGVVAPTFAENWPGWRGPRRNGVTTDIGVPTSWSATQNVVWKTPLPGQGISNPIVWDDSVIVTAADGRDQSELHVICLDRDSGRERWHRRLWGTAPGLFHATKSSMATPSPVTDGQRVFAFFGTGDVFAFDMNGGLLWQRSFAQEYGAFENRFAASSSPLLFEDSLILQVDHYGESYLISLEERTGANRWKVDRKGVWLSWSSPQLVPVGQKSELVLSGSEKLDGYDPRSGQWLWTIGGLARECVPTPVFGNGLLYVVSGPNGSNLAITPGGRGDVSETHVVWRYTRGSSFVPSPILVGERYYLVDDKGIAICLDANSGKSLWRRRFYDSYTASPVAADGKIFFVNEYGSTLVLDATREYYNELARNEVNEEVYASPAISQGRLFLRTTKNLICIGTK